MEIIDRWGRQGMTLELKRDRDLLDPEQLETERQANVESEAKLQRENDELARGVLDLTRRLTIAEQRTKHAEELAERAMADAGRWRRSGLEGERLSYMAHSAAFQKLRGRVRHELGDQASGGHLLPLTYFPSGEEPGARWGLTDLGQQAIDAGRVKGPEWTLLVSPDPREVLSIEVRSGSRQETIYRAAGYVTAENPDVAGGHFLGLLEAFVEAARAEDATLGRAMKALESLYVLGLHERVADFLAEAQHRVDEVLEGKAPSTAPPASARTMEDLCARAAQSYGGETVEAVYEEPPHQACGAVGRLGIYHPERPVAETFRLAADQGDTIAPSYDLAAVCARCGRERREHPEWTLGAADVPCDGFLAEAAP